MESTTLQDWDSFNDETCASQGMGSPKKTTSGFKSDEQREHRGGRSSAVREAPSMVVEHFRQESVL